MADNPSIDPGTTPTIPVEGDDIAGQGVAQVVALRFGAKDATTRVSTGAPLPVDDDQTQAALATILTALGGGGVLATQVTLAAILTKLQASIATTSAAGSQADGHSASIGGTADGASGAGGGTVIAHLRKIRDLLAAGIGITGTVAVSGNVADTNAAGSQVDGHSATIGATTDASAALTLVGLLKAIKAAVVGTLSTANPDTVAVGTLTALNQVVTLNLGAGQSTLQIDATGTFVATWTLEISIDGANFFTYPIGQFSSINAGGLNVNATSATPTRQVVACAGWAAARLRCSAYTSGTVNVTLRATGGTNVVQLGASLPNGTNQIGFLTTPSTGNAPAQFTATANTTIFTNSATAKLRTFMNDSDQDLLLNLSAAAVTTTVYTVRVKANGGFFATDFSGQVQGMMVAAIGSGQVIVQSMT
jgi:hypothetical protein